MPATMRPREYPVARYVLLAPGSQIVEVDATATKGATFIDYEITRDPITGARRFVLAKLLEDKK
jgi:hypothetical protein